MNRRGFLGLLGAVPLAGVVPRAVSAVPVTRRIPVARRVVADLDLSTVLPGTLVVCEDCETAKTATFRVYGTEAPPVGNWVRVAVAGEAVFVGQILRVTRTFIRSAPSALSYFDVFADSEGLRR